MNKYFEKNKAFCLCVILLVVFSSFNFTSPLKNTNHVRASGDGWWSGPAGGHGTYQKRLKIKVTATDGTLHSGTSVFFKFDSAYMLSAGLLHANAGNTDGKDLRLVYTADGENFTELDRVVTQDWNDVVTVVYFPIQEDITEGNNSEKYWLYYDNDEGETATIKDTKASVFGAHAKSYVPFTSPNPYSVIAGTSAGAFFTHLGVNEPSDLSSGGDGNQQVSGVASRDINGSAGTIEMWARGPFNSDYTSFWSLTGCGVAEGCRAKYYNTGGSHKISWLLDSSNNWLTTSEIVGLNDGNAWYHLAFTWDSSGAEIFVDGVSVASTATVPTIPTADGVVLGIGKRINNNTLIGQIDEFWTYDNRKTAGDLNNYKFKIELETNLYGPRNIMETTRVLESDIANPLYGYSDYFFADGSSDYFYALSWRSHSSDGYTDYYLLKQRKSDLSVVYSYSLNPPLITYGMVPRALGSDPATGKVVVSVFGIAASKCPVENSNDKLFIFSDTGAAFTLDHTFTSGTDNPGFTLPMMLSEIKDGNIYLTSWYGNHTCSGATVIEKNPSVTKIDLSTSPPTLTTLTLYTLDLDDGIGDAQQNDDGLTHMTFDDNGYMYVMRYNRVGDYDAATGYTPSVYKVKLSDFTLETSFGVEARGVGINKIVGEDAIWIDGRSSHIVAGQTVGAQLRKYSLDGTLLQEIASPSSVRGSEHIQLPVSKIMAVNIGGSELLGFGQTWVADPNYYNGANTLESLQTYGKAEPAFYDTGSRFMRSPDSILADSDGYMYFPTYWGVLSTKFTSGISSSYSDVSVSSDAVIADGSSKLTVTVNLKSLENKATLPENLSVVLVPSTTDGLAMASNSGYALEQGFAGSTNSAGVATFEITSAKTNHIKFSVRAEGITLNETSEVDFVKASNKDYSFASGNDYDYDSQALVFSGGSVRPKSNNIPSSDWIAPDSTSGKLWMNRKKITFTSNTNKLPSALTNFPVLIDITDSDLSDKTTNGDDIVFTSSDGKTKLDHEIESYSSGHLRVWVEVDSISPSSEIFMYYNNADTTAQQNASGTWGNDYKAVWHYNEQAGTTATDSSGNSNTATTYVYKSNSPAFVSDGPDSTGVWDATGKFGGGITGNGTYLRMDQSSSLAITTRITFSGWVNFTALATGKPILSLANNWAFQKGIVMLTNSSDSTKLCLAAGSGAEANKNYICSVTGTIAAGNWYHVMGTFNSTASGDNGLGTTVLGESKLYVNGVEVASDYGDIQGDAITALAATTAIECADDGESASISTNCLRQRAYHHGAESAYYMNGDTDEFRIAAAARSAAWAKAEYNNQNSPGDFISFGNEEALYSTGETVLTPKSGQNYTSLSCFSEVIGSQYSLGEIRYQISADNGTIWYWWNGSAWTTTSAGYSEANTDDNINTHFADFTAGSGTKTFKWKAIFNNDESQYPILGDVLISYLYAPPTPTPSPSPTPSPTAIPSSAPTATATAASSSSADQEAVRLNVITKYKTSDYAFVFGVNALGQDGSTREDVNLTTDKIIDIYDQSPIFRGITYPNSDITIELTDSSGRKITGKTTSDSDGYWQWQPTEKLSAGEYTVVITVENKAKGVNFTSDQYKFKIAEKIKASTPIIGQNPKEEKSADSQKIWIYTVALIGILGIGTILFFVLKRKRRKK